MTVTPPGPASEAAGRHRARHGAPGPATQPWFTSRRFLVPAGVAALAVVGLVLVDRPAPPLTPSAATRSPGSTPSTATATATTPAPSGSPSGTPSPSVSAVTGVTAAASPSATPAPTPAAEPGPRTATLAGDGTYDVGSDMKPGLYRSQGSGTWARLKDASGAVESIIANGDVRGWVEYVQVMRTDGYFATQGMGDWALVDPTATGPQATTFDGDGTYMVGVDIRPGTYTSSGGGFWKRLKSASGEYGDIIANDNATGRTTVEIKKTDRFFSTQGMGRWTLAK
ncbi:hypothetical protein [Oryzobacter terrae]|uniref:hypothetical protein n=1 Tax=Oryzobacter terrae TaxID=1620385 RepID=UPI0036729B6F